MSIECMSILVQSDESANSCFLSLVNFNRIFWWIGIEEKQTFGSILINNEYPEYNLRKLGICASTEGRKLRREPHSQNYFSKDKLNSGPILFTQVLVIAKNSLFFKQSLFLKLKLSITYKILFKRKELKRLKYLSLAPVFSGMLLKVKTRPHKLY